MKKLFALIVSVMLLFTLTAFAEETVVNPWQDIDEAAAQAMYPFTLPEGAGNVICRRMDDMLEVQFTLAGAALNYRVASAGAEDDISGMYFIWETETAVQVGWNEALLCTANDEGEQVQLISWYDAVPGVAYALSAQGEDLSALDLTAVAVTLYTPTQSEANGFTFAEVEGLPFNFSSGVGAWDCEINIDAEGCFTGSYHDSDMGDAGEGYENGTVYTSDFHGKLTIQGPGEEPCTWLVTVSELEMDEGLVPGTELFEDGFRYVITEPAGLKLGNTMILYTRGAAIDIISEDAAFWFHLNDFELLPGDTLPLYGLYDEAEQTGFVANPLR